MKNQHRGDDPFDRQNVSVGLTNTPLRLGWLISTRPIWQLLPKQSIARWCKNGGRLKERQRDFPPAATQAGDAAAGTARAEEEAGRVGLVHDGLGGMDARSAPASHVLSMTNLG